MKSIKPILFSFAIFSSIQVVAQQDTIKTENIEIIKEYRPFIEDGKKQQFQPAMPRLQENTNLNLNYSIPQEFIETQYEPDEIRPLPLQNQETTKVKKVYLKAGYGNQSNPLGQLAINGLEANNYSIGALLDYEGVKGDLSDQQMSKADLTIFANKEMSNASLHGEFNYDRIQNNFYGYDHEDPILQQIFFDSKQIYNVVGGQLGIGSAVIDPSAFHYELTGFYNGLNQDTYKVKESQMGLKTELSTTVGRNFPVGLKADLNSRNTKTPANNVTTKSDDLVIHGTPYIKPSFGNINTTLGVSLNSDDANGFKIFPALSIEIPISTDQLFFYAGWNGRTMVNGIQQLAQKNPWLSSQTWAQNYTEQIMTPAGLKGSINSQFGFNLSVSQVVSENVPLFVNGEENGVVDLFSYSRFTPVYETKLSAWRPSGDLNFQFGEVAKILASVDYNLYKTESEAEAWQLPKLDAGLSLEIKPIDKLSINGGFNSLSGIKYKNANLETGTLDGIFNVNLGARFDLNDQISIFLDGNNLTNKDQMQWKNYSTVGTNILAGIVLSY